MKSVLFGCAMLATHLFATSFTFGESVDVADRQEALNLVLKNRDYCVARELDGKLYVKPDRLYPTKEGVFLHIAWGELVRLERVFSDEKGCYIPLTDD